MDNMNYIWIALAVVLGILLVLYLTRPQRKSNDAGNGKCTSEEHNMIKSCEAVYDQCLQAALASGGDLSACHQEFMDKCFPLIQKCMDEEEGS